MIQTSSLASINQQYSPEKNRRSRENSKPLTGRSGQAIQTKQEKQQKIKVSKQTDTQCRNSKRLSGNKDKENISKNDVQNTEDMKVLRKKIRRSNTYSNVSNQGLMIPVINGNTVQGQMDTSLIEIVDKCNVSGIQPLEQSLECPGNEKNLDVCKKKGSATKVYEEPSFLEKSHVSPDMDKIVSQIIPFGSKKEDELEPSFIKPNLKRDAIKDCSWNKVTNVKLEVLKQIETFHDSLENGEVVGETSKYQEQPSFLSPQNVTENARTYHLRRSARKSGGKIYDSGGVTTEVKLLKSAKRRSGRRSITKERRRSSLNKSTGSKSVLDQLKSLRTFIKEKSFEIESGDESFHKANNNVNCINDKTEGDKKENLNSCTQPGLQGITKTNDRQEDVFLPDPSKMKLLESQKPSEASPRRTTFTVLRRNQVVKSPARSKSEGYPQQNVLAALDEALNEADDSNIKHANVIAEKLTTNEDVRNSVQVEEQRNKSESMKRLYSADSLENDSFEPLITSRKQLKLEKEESAERRMRLTVTKYQPSDILLHQIELQTATLFKAVETSMECCNADKCENSIPGNNRKSQADVTFEKPENKTDKSTQNVSFPSTPNQLPSSPNPDHSRRSTHIIRQPRIIDLSKIEQKELFQGKYESKEEEKLHDSPTNNTKTQLSGRNSILNNKDLNKNTDKQTEEPARKKENDETKVKPEDSNRNGLLFIPFVGKDKENGAKDVPSRPKTVVDPKQFLRKRDHSVTTAASQPKRVKKEKADVQKQPSAIGKKMSKESQKVAIKTSKCTTNIG